MKKSFLVILIIISNHTFSQSIGDFTSITPTTQSVQFIIPATHTFQKIIEVGDPLIVNGTMLTKPDFTGYVPISGSSLNGYLSVNSEDAPVILGGTGGGGVTVLDVNFNNSSKLWDISSSETLDFTSVGQTAANCSGTVTSWGTVISCEEFAYSDALGLIDFNDDGYNDIGWNVEINPATKTVIGKHWAMGNMAHENVTIHSNERTVYQGADSNPGYLYKFVATTAQDLSEGNLFVFSGSKNGMGNWIQIPNTTITERNTTISLSNTAGGTIFNGIEDVEIGPDGMVYFAVKSENSVYRFQDSNPLTGTTLTMETYVGNMSYNINDGINITSVAWGSGNDNLAFDGDGNLWVLQDGGNNHIWVVRPEHTQANPKVDIFGTTPLGSEPTGITFTPDYKYLFMSILLGTDPASNNAGQLDAANNTVNFNRGTTLVIALKGNLGTTLSIDHNSLESRFKLFPNPVKSSERLVIKGKQIDTVKIYSILGELILNENYAAIDMAQLNLKNMISGLYLIQINNQETLKLIVR